MGDEDAVEAAVWKGESQRVPAHPGGAGGVAAGDAQHGRALIEAQDRALEVPGEITGPTSHVEDPGGGKTRHQADEGRPLLLPARPLAGGEEALTRVPVVVLTSAAIVVGPHPPMLSDPLCMIGFWLLARGRSPTTPAP
jgi:hypothetical protein